MAPSGPIGDVEAMARAMHHSLEYPMPPDVLRKRVNSLSYNAINAYEQVLFGKCA